MAKSFRVERIEVDKKALGEWLQKNSGVEKILVNLGEKIRAEAARTASDAENGPGGKITGYAGAGFKVVYDKRSRRPVCKIISNANNETAKAAHFNSQRKNGIGHLRAALYKYSTMNNVKRYSGR
jgi:hypothetical protein